MFSEKPSLRDMVTFENQAKEPVSGRIVGRCSPNSTWLFDIRDPAGTIHFNVTLPRILEITQRYRPIAA